MLSLTSFEFLETARRATIVQNVQKLGSSEGLPVEHFQFSASQLFHHAHLSGSMMTGLFWVLMFALAVLAVVLLVMLVLIFSGRMLGGMIRTAIEKYDKDVIGVDVELEQLDVALWTGKLNMKGLIVHNPAPYTAKYLLRVKEVLIDINVTKLLLSRFKTIEVETLIFDKVEAIWEKSGPFHSNVKQILEFVEEKQAQAAKDADQVEQEVKEPGADATAKEEKPADSANGSKEPTKLKIREMRVRDVKVKMASKMLQGHGAWLSLADIEYADFSTANTSVVLVEAIRTILRSFLKTVVTNTMGKSIGDHFF